MKTVKRLLLSIISLALASSLSHADGMSAQLAWQTAETHSTGLVLALDRSLVEREQQRIELDSAYPEASPATAPFSLSRPEDFVSNYKNVPEPSTWALLGLGATFLVFFVPGRGGKFALRRTNS